MSKLIKPDLVLLAKNIEVETFNTGRQVIDDKINMVDWQMGMVNQDHKYDNIIKVADLDYDGDWRQIMPVVQKIYLLVEFKFKGSKFESLAKNVRKALAETAEIDKVFPEVVIFAEFYNKREHDQA